MYGDNLNSKYGGFYSTGSSNGLMNILITPAPEEISPVFSDDVENLEIDEIEEVEDELDAIERVTGLDSKSEDEEARDPNGFLGRIKGASDNDSYDEVSEEDYVAKRQKEGEEGGEDFAYKSTEPEITSEIIVKTPEEEQPDEPELEVRVNTTVNVHIDEEMQHEIKLHDLVGVQDI